MCLFLPLAALKLFYLFFAHILFLFEFPQAVFVFFGMLFILRNAATDRFLLTLEILLLTPRFRLASLLQCPTLLCLLVQKFIYVVLGLLGVGLDGHGDIVNDQ